MAYARPVLCRLCRFPAPDGSVPVSQVEREKLSEWCLRLMDTKLDQEGLEKAVICQFCVMDARLEHQFSVETGHPSNSSLNWWSRADIPIWEKYYTGEVIQPCSVQMECMSAKQYKEASTNLQKEKKKAYRCVYCSEEFPSKIKMKIHSTHTHKDKPNFWCQLCFINFKSNSENRTHFKTAHKDKSLCVYCGAKFERHAMFKIHLQKRHKKQAIQCKYNKNCTIYFKSQAERKEHIKEKHESDANRSKCIYCNKFILAEVLYLHIQQEHRSEAIRCDFYNCAKHFLTDEEKKKHFEQVHMGKRLTCIYCWKYSVDSKGIFYAHMEKYHSSEAIKCNFNKKCPTFFLTDEERQRHIRDVHDKKFLTNVQCIYCKKIYSDYLSLTKHVKDIHKDVMIKCKWRGCHQFFLTDTKHEEHFQQAHAAKEQQKNLQCDICSYKTHEKNLLQKHLVFQHGAENLQCPKCPKVYKSQIALTSHIDRIHSNKPKAKCSVCLKAIRNIGEHLRKKRCCNCDFVSDCVTENIHHRKMCNKRYK